MDSTAPNNNNSNNHNNSPPSNSTAVFPNSSSSSAIPSNNSVGSLLSKDQSPIAPAAASSALTSSLPAPLPPPPFNSNKGSPPGPPPPTSNLSGGVSGQIIPNAPPGIQGQIQAPIQGQPAAAAAPSSSRPPLNVKDALSYLDQVKNQFSRQPEVYNQFLDIMRDFKANSIDTPGVIERVSNLFRGYPTLIRGFNTFLPPGYKIEVVSNGPLGGGNYTVQTSFQGGNMNTSSVFTTSNQGGGNLVNGVNPNPNNAPNPNNNNGNLNFPHHPYQQQQQQQHIQQIQAHHPAQQQQPILQQSIHPNANNNLIPPPPVPSSAATGRSPYVTGQPQRPGVPPNPASASAAANKGPVEFNHAINYVNRIKNRFANEPEIYRSFLEILQTYHREQRGIFEVYSQVESLFRNHPDLLDEFKQFLPEKSASSAPSSVPASGPPPPSQGAMNNGPPLGSFNNPVAAAATERRGSIKYSNKNNNVNNAIKDNNNVFVNGVYQQQQQQIPPQIQQQPSVNNLTNNKRFHNNNNGALGTSLNKKLKTNPKVEQIYQTVKNEFEEFEFFDKVKALLNSKTVYAEFLKCLNLYTQEVISLEELVKLVHGFLGSKGESLFEYFTRFVGYKSEEGGDNFPPLLKDSVAGEVPHLDLTNAKCFGSYRELPGEYRNSPCSGRDPLGDEVLNDVFVSCPVFTSEDNSFVNSKKNTFEENLFRCEDERFEMDLLISLNHSTIQVLEALETKLELGEGIEKLQLGNNLTGTSHVLYAKAIKRVYGPEKGTEVMEHLKKNPAVAVPIVLRRLKLKDEEWRKCQREWNKVWKEIHIKNHYKALDHQGVNFKTNDRKSISSKALVQEIETLLIEQQRGISNSNNNGKKNPDSTNQLEYAFDDLDLVCDIIALIAFGVKRSSSSSFSNQDKRSILDFLASFVQKFFNVKVSKEDIFKPSPSPDEDDNYFDDDNNNNNFANVADEETKNSNNFSLNYFNNFKNSFVFYGNNSFYVFFRLFQLAYYRLKKMKDLATEFDQTGKYPSHQYVSPLGNFLDNFKPPLFDLKAKEYYPTALRFIRQLMDSTIDPNTFEDHFRYMFGSTHAYLLFTFDKLIMAIGRQIQSIVGDPKSEQLIALYEQERDVEKTSFRSEFSFRSAADSVIGDEKENIFRIKLSTVSKASSGGGYVLQIQLLDRQAFERDLHSVEEKWSLYVDNFVKLSDNEGDEQGVNGKKIFLRRSLNISSSNMNRQGGLVIKYNLECKICVNTYKMFFVENSEDFLYYHQSKLDSVNNNNKYGGVKDWKKRLLKGGSDEEGITNWIENGELPSAR